MAVVWPSKNNFANGDVLTATNMNNIGDTLNVFNPTSATNGQVWIANGSGSGAYGTPTAGGYTVLQSGSLTGASISLTGIAGTYRDLVIQLNGALATSAQSLRFRLNADTGTNYNYVILTGGVTPTDVNNATSFPVNATAMDNALGFAVDFRIPYYSANQSTAKVVTASVAYTTSSSSKEYEMMVGFWNTATSAAVTGVSFFPSSGNFSYGNYRIMGLS